MTSPSTDHANGSHAWWWRDWLFAAALTLAVFLTYQPAWHGGFVWDDDAHITKPELRSFAGLGRIWSDIHATQQYYPLLHSSFWLQHRLWGDSPLGYHLVGMALHSLTAALVLFVLRRLKIPGPYWAAAVFALHPVHVESVAWITEQKNTLSGLFYLSALLGYLRFEEERKPRWWALSFLLFVLGLLSKTVTATLPAALLVIAWWRRGRLSWKTDVRPLTPFFLLGACSGLFTAWVERTLIGAEGAEFAFTGVERCLIAGRTAWFYLAKLVWPADLMFFYPRWHVGQGIWWQYLFPLAAAVVLVALWLLRRRTRAPLAAALYFGGTLFPVLGFFNVYPFRYSFVADHFQYLASLGVIVGVSAAAAGRLSRARGWTRAAGKTACVVAVCVLAILSWQQSRIYRDEETLYRATLARNPGSWLARNNLGLILAGQGKADDAIRHYREALRLDPGYAAAHHNLGAALASQGKADDAIRHYREALRIDPGLTAARYNWGSLLLDQGKFDEAIRQYEDVLRINPSDSKAHNNLGVALLRQGKAAAATRHFRETLRLDPGHVKARYNLSGLLLEQCMFDDAINHCREALRLDPRYASAVNLLCEALQRKAEAQAAAGRFPEAATTAREAAAIAAAQGDKELAERIGKRIEAY